MMYTTHVKGFDAFTHPNMRQARNGSKQHWKRAAMK